MPLVMTCPANGARSRPVSLLTLKSLLLRLPPMMPKTQYYFCEAPGCDVVYFPLDKQAPIFRRDDLIVRVGTKETADPIPICYCFGFTRKDIQSEIAETGQSTIANRISEEVKAGTCACEVKNPSGKCCLGNVARAVEAAYEQTKTEGEVARSPARSRTSRP